MVENLPKSFLELIIFSTILVPKFLIALRPNRIDLFIGVKPEPLSFISGESISIPISLHSVIFATIFSDKLISVDISADINSHG